MIDENGSARQDFVKYRRRMRGISTFFILVTCLGLAGIIILALIGGTDQNPVETLWESGFYAIMLLITALMAWNGSRFGAVLLLLLALSGFVDLYATKDAAVITGLVRTSLYSGLAVALIWSAHRYHQECSIEDHPLGGSAIVRWAGLALSVPAIGAIGLGVMVLSSPISTEVVAGSEIHQDHLAWMAEQNFLLADETILYFYSDGLLSVSEGGSLLTDKYIGTWWQQDGELISHWYRLGEVCEIETVQAGSYLSDAVYKIHSAGEDNWFTINLSIEEDGDDRLIRRMTVINQRNMHPVVKSACEAGESIDRSALALAHGIAPGIVSADLMTPGQIAWLKEKEYLTTDEAPLRFHSSGEYHIDEGGSLLTDRYFGGWYRDKGKLLSVWAKIGGICTIEQLDAGDQNSDQTGAAVYKITYGEDGWYRFDLPRFEGGDTALIEQLKRMNIAAMTPESTAICDNRKQTSPQPASN